MSLKWIPQGFLSSEEGPLTIQEIHGSVYTATPEEVGVREIHGSIFVKLP